MIELFALSLIAHELGHLLYFYSLGIKTSIHFNSRNWKLQVGYPKDYENLTDLQLIKLYTAGIIPGLIIIVIYCLISKWYVIVLPFYISGCRKDLDNILTITRNSNKYYS